MRRNPHKQFIKRLDEALKDKAEQEKRSKKYSRADIGQIAGGIKASSVTGWYNNNLWPKIETTVKLAEHLGVCVEWLYTGKGPKTPAALTNLNTQESELIELYRALSKDNQSLLMRDAQQLTQTINIVKQTRSAVAKT